MAAAAGGGAAGAGAGGSPTAAAMETGGGNGRPPAGKSWAGGLMRTGSNLMRSNSLPVVAGPDGRQQEQLQMQSWDNVRL